MYIPYHINNGDFDGLHGIIHRLGVSRRKNMKAQVYRGVNQLRYEDVPVPELDTDEVLVQVQVVGLCQSDIKKILYPLYAPPVSLVMKQPELLQRREQMSTTGMWAIG